MSKEKKITESIEEEPIVDTEPVVYEEPIVDAEPVVKVEDSIIVGTVSANTCYMRKEPMKAGAINLFLKKGDTVIITADGDVGNYYLVTAQTKIGYVLKNEITIE